MRVVFVSDWLADKMGYAENLFPKAMARLGVEVHLVTSDLQPPLPDYREIYEPFLGPRDVPTGIYQLNEFTVHRLRHGAQRHNVYIRGLHRKLADLRPHIVQCFTVTSFSTNQAAFSKLLLGYKLFLEEHGHNTVYRPPGTLKGRILLALYSRTYMKLLGTVTEECYATGDDVAYRVSDVLGYPKSKLQSYSLGVDTDCFSPPTEDEALGKRREMRSMLGFYETDIVCVFSGRLTASKNPQSLARAVNTLQDINPRFKALFIGRGVDAQIELLKSYRGCTIHPFVLWNDLADYYRASDIGVWPAQETTSQLDAMACGLPLIAGKPEAGADLVDGKSGLWCKPGDVDDLVEKLLTLADDDKRRQMGERAAQKIRDKYSWTLIARQRLKDYDDALRLRR